MSNLLPIAAGEELREQARLLARRHRFGLIVVVFLHASAATAGLAGPPLLGRLVQSVQDGTTTGYVDKVIAILAGALIVQTVLTWFARRASFVLSETMFAELREDFMRRVLALPLSTVERAGTGDLVSRTTADIDALTRTIRFAIPETLIAAVTALLTVAAAVWVSPLAALPCLTGVPVLFAGTRWYLARAPAGYLWERAAYAHADRHRRRDRRRRPHDRGARPERGARRPDRRRSDQRLRGRTAHALPADGVVPVGRVRVRAAGRSHVSRGAAGWSRTAARRWAR